MDYSGACLYDLHRDWQASEHAGELHWYVQPLVVEEVPSSTGMTTGTRDLVAKMNKGEVLRGADPVLLEEEAAAFLASNDTLLLLLGETGSGKSMFSWLTVHKCAHVFGAAAKGIWEVSETASGDSRGSSNSSDSVGHGRTGPGDELVAWVPIVIELKQYKTSELGGLVQRSLQDFCGLNGADLRALCSDSTSLATLPRIGVVAICDGFDELQAEESERATKAVRTRLRDFFSVVTDAALGGWAAGMVKVVVTTRTRESGLRYRGDENTVFGKHRRRVLLPFNDAQV